MDVPSSRPFGDTNRNATMQPVVAAMRREVRLLLSALRVRF